MILCSVREDSNQTAHRVIIKLYFIEMLSCEFEHHIILDHRGGLIDYKKAHSD